MAKIDELHNYAYPSSYLDELHRYDQKDHSSDEIHVYGNRGAVYGGLDEVHLYGGYQTVVEDEANVTSERQPIDIDEYFDEIDDLDEGQKEERKELAKDFRDILLFVLMLIFADLRVGNEIDADFYQQMLKGRLMDAVDDHVSAMTVTTRNKISSYLGTNARQVIESTVRNQEDAYFFSETRAITIAVDDSMATYNVEELDEAVRAGYTGKKWITMRDNKVRHTHEMVDDKEIPIGDSFTVGRCRMTMPMVFAEDSPHEDAKEVINCRCCLIYTKLKSKK